MSRTKHARILVSGMKLRKKYERKRMTSDEILLEAY